MPSRKCKKLANGDRVYGPYTRKDERQHVVIVRKDGSKRTVSYPKWLMEQKLGRELHPTLETVDHKDNDHTNNKLSNLRVLPLRQHAKEDALRLAPAKVKCVWCRKIFKRVIHPRAKSGPFCSRKCSGQYGASVQNGGKKIKRVHVPKTYYRLKTKKIKKK